ncbi:lysophospholipase [Vibrio sp. 10N.286.49.C2]|uniref:alpha/beta fold hydrolase n=1 Tax=unclassified Vibrio TaxID=2614977 RepID=UPI000C82B07C|nr:MULTISPECIES: alpha/beta fold hydrolase [unclassified Vibrio]PMH35581.1 lysophospholipase [Vibrio sp. 10N.286.49.C2]PMH49870.1 lysophospholipase [Vibrio sp. 10N.286.49.B1]PMH81109.1 lysophospholipase [Vibrio sp. 10N.286.48.B7]
MTDSNLVSNPYTQEQDFEQVIHAQIAEFWACRHEGREKAKDGTSLYWCKLTNPNHRKALVVVNGRIESAWKYQELFYDFYQLGYDIYSFDHRGQGMSTHLAPNPEMGHIGEFSDYLDDMQLLLSKFDLQHYEERHLLAHSMGGAIATRYIQTRPEHNFDKIALSAPMYGVNVPCYFRPFVTTVAQIMTAVYPVPTYAPGYQGYIAKPFDINPLSQSEVRYRWFRDLYEQKPELKIGGPSTRWVWQGLIAAKQCTQQTRQVKIPLLLLQAGSDMIVNNDAQTHFIRKLHKTNKLAKINVIEGAKHEVLFEKDVYRNQAMEAINAFFNPASSA